MDRTQVFSTLKEFEKRYKAEMKKGDRRKFVSTFYHRHAVCVHGGGAGVAYGHEGITKFYGGDQSAKCEKDETPNGGKDESTTCGMQECAMETSYESYDQAGDGEYLVLKSLTWEKKNPEQKCFCEQIFKRTDDGGYVIYHEEFGMCGGGCAPNADKDGPAKRPCDSTSGDFFPLLISVFMGYQRSWLPRNFTHYQYEFE